MARIINLFGWFSEIIIKTQIIERLLYLAWACIFLVYSVISPKITPFIILSSLAVIFSMALMLPIEKDHKKIKMIIVTLNLILLASNYINMLPHLFKYYPLKAGEFLYIFPLLLFFSYDIIYFVVLWLAPQKKILNCIPWCLDDND